MLMFGSFRRGEANDPEIYATAIAKVLSGYDRGVIDFVTDPATGMASKSDFLPTVNELKKACEEKAGEYYRAERRERLIQEQLEARATLAISDQRAREPNPNLITAAELGDRRPIGRFERAPVLDHQSGDASSEAVNAVDGPQCSK